MPRARRHPISSQLNPGHAISSSSTPHCQHHSCHRSAQQLLHTTEAARQLCCCACTASPQLTAAGSGQPIRLELRLLPCNRCHIRLAVSRFEGQVSSRVSAIMSACPRFPSGRCLGCLGTPLPSRDLCGPCICEFSLSNLVDFSSGSFFSTHGVSCFLFVR